MSGTFDDAVVGSGILGLAHAYHLATMGRRVIVLERSYKAEGASVRNFGMLWPIGQPAGELRSLAMRSRAIWVDVLSKSGLWFDPVGSLHLAYEPDEAAVLKEFAAQASTEDLPCELLYPSEIARRSPFVKQDRLICGLFSPSEACVDPREVIARFPAWLTKEFGVQFEFGCTALRYDRPTLETSRVPFEVNRLWICSGADLQTLYPGTFGSFGLIPCKLQMLRTNPLSGGRRLGPMLAAGLTLRHYKSFEGCPSLPALRMRVARENPMFDRFGIHVMASQNGLGELILGDSHEYGVAIDPFDKVEIDQMILDYLSGFLRIGEIPQVVARWHGIYVKHPQKAYCVANAGDGVNAVTGVGGAGMTLSFGLAEKIVAGVLGEEGETAS